MAISGQNSTALVDTNAYDAGQARILIKSLQMPSKTVRTGMIVRIASAEPLVIL